MGHQIKAYNIFFLSHYLVHPRCFKSHVGGVFGSVWLKSQVEWSCFVPVLLLFGYKVTKWLQLGNILLRSGTNPLQKINGTEPLRSQTARTARPPIRAQQLARLPLQPNKNQSRSVPVHSATKKTESLRSSLPNTEHSGSVPRIRDGMALFYLAAQLNTT
jgi:hypothetical protein